MSRRIFLVAAEPSGDQLGAEVAVELQDQDPDIRLAGIGGAEMASVGLTSNIDVSPISVLGLFEGLKAYPKVIKLADAAVDEMLAFNPDAVVLVDSWGFMLRVAQRLRKRAPNVHLIKLIGPQVWATRAGRAKTLAGTVDHLLAMFEMEVPFYEPHGLKTTVIGSPAIGRVVRSDGEAFRAKHSIRSDGEILLLLPGSRPGEIKRVAPNIVAAASIIKSERPQTQIFVSAGGAVSVQFDEQFPDVSNIAKVLRDPADRYDAMAAADLAIACSGTVTTELAMQGTPFIAGYKLGWATWAIARAFLYKPKFMTILNIAAGKEVAPEFLQTKFNDGLVAETVLELLSNPNKRQAQIALQNDALSKLGIGMPPAAQRAAEAILADLSD